MDDKKRNKTIGRRFARKIVISLLFTAVLLTATSLFASYDPASNLNQLWGSESPYAGYQRYGNGAPYVRYDPEIVLSDYSVIDKGLVAGGDITMEFEFTNTSRLSGVFDLVVTFGTSPTTIYPIYGETNQSFITAIPPEGAATVVKSFSIATAPPEIIDMQVRTRYEGVGTGSRESAMQIYLPIFSANSLSSQINIDSTVYTGSQVLLSGYCGNTSKRGIIDLEMILKGDFIESPKSFSLGGLAPGEQIPVTGSLVFPHENSSAEISISFAFSDHDGNRIELPAQSQRVMVINQPEMGQIQSGGLLSSPSYLAAAGALALLVVVAIVTITSRITR